MQTPITGHPHATSSALCVSLRPWRLCGESASAPYADGACSAACCARSAFSSNLPTLVMPSPSARHLTTCPTKRILIPVVPPARRHHSLVAQW
jgi:hypothetical protein